MLLKEKTYTTKNIFRALDCENNKNITDTGQYHATVIVMRNCKNVKSIFNQVLTCIDDDKFLLTDKYNTQQEKYFIDNRHDQSILSVVRKKHKTIILNDRSYMKKNCPIEHTRIRN